MHPHALRAPGEQRLREPARCRVGRQRALGLRQRGAGRGHVHRAHARGPDGRRVRGRPVGEGCRGLRVEDPHVRQELPPPVRLPSPDRGVVAMAGGVFLRAGPHLEWAGGEPQVPGRGDPGGHRTPGEEEGRRGALPPVLLAVHRGGGEHHPVVGEVGEERFTHPAGFREGGEGSLGGDERGEGGVRGSHLRGQGRGGGEGDDRKRCESLHGAIGGGRADAWHRHQSSIFADGKQRKRAPLRRSSLVRSGSPQRVAELRRYRSIVHPPSWR